MRCAHWHSYIALQYIDLPKKLFFCSFSFFTKCSVTLSRVTFEWHLFFSLQKKSHVFCVEILHSLLSSEWVEIKQKSLNLAYKCSCLNAFWISHGKRTGFNNRTTKLKHLKDFHGISTRVVTCYKINPSWDNLFFFLSLFAHWPTHHLKPGLLRGTLSCSFSKVSDVSAKRCLKIKRPSGPAGATVI